MKRIIRGTLLMILAFPICMMARQDKRAEEIRLDIQIQKNGVVVAKPSIIMRIDVEAKVIHPGAVSTITAKRLDEKAVEVFWKYETSNGSPQFAVRLVENKAVSVPLTIDRDAYAFELTLGRAH